VNFWEAQHFAYAAGGLVGQAIARGRHKKKGKKVIEEEKTPEQILASHKKNFSIDYRDIDKATVKRKACKMKFAAKQFGLPRGLRKKVVFLYDKKDKDSIASALTKVIPDKVVVK
jgi:hypothetical protein